MRFEEYRKHDAISLAGLIAKRQVSAKEVAMSITVIGISLVGDGLREVLDPRLGGR